MSVSDTDVCDLLLTSPGGGGTVITAALGGCDEPPPPDKFTALPMVGPTWTNGLTIFWLPPAVAANNASAFFCIIADRFDDATAADAAAFRGDEKRGDCGGVTVCETGAACDAFADFNPFFKLVSMFLGAILAWFCAVNAAILA